MSSAEPFGLRFVTGVALALLVLASAGCQVRPLYASGPAVIDGTTGAVAPLADISIDDVADRPSQIVRNQLIFLLNGGAEPRGRTRYGVTLNISSQTSSAAFVQIAREDEPSAGTVTLRSAYEVRDNETGEIVRRGSRQVSASFDVPRQAFAALRAERDAQDRAGRELAELLRLAIAQDLERPDFRAAVSPPIAEVTPRPGNQTDGQILD